MAVREIIVELIKKELVGEDITVRWFPSSTSIVVNNKCTIRVYDNHIMVKYLVPNLTDVRDFDPANPSFNPEEFIKPVICNITNCPPLDELKYFNDNR